MTSVEDRLTKIETDAARILESLEALNQPVYPGRTTADSFSYWSDDHEQQKGKSAARGVAALQFPDGYKPYSVWKSFGDWIKEGIRDPGGFRQKHFSIFKSVQGMSEGVGADGGFAVLPEFNRTIFDRVYENDLFSRTDHYTVSGNNMTFPKTAETSRAHGSRHGGLRGYWVSEGATIPASKPELAELSLKLKKLAVVVYLTEAWVDADILFDDDCWWERASAALRQYHVIQPWTFAQWLNEQGEQEEWREGVLCLPSTGFQSSKGRAIADGHPGLAWAARRSFVQSHGLYDRHIAGGGDLAMVLGLVGSRKNWHFAHWNDAMIRSVVAWGDAAAEEAAGRIGCISGGVRHLWHGSRIDRKYSERNINIAEFGFDPERHLEMDEGGLWRWTAEAPNLLQEYLRHYMASRREGAQA